MCCLVEERPDDWQRKVNKPPPPRRSDCAALQLIMHKPGQNSPRRMDIKACDRSDMQEKWPKPSTATAPSERSSKGCKIQYCPLEERRSVNLPLPCPSNGQDLYRRSSSFSGKLSLAPSKPNLHGGDEPGQCTVKYAARSHEVHPKKRDHNLLRRRNPSPEPGPSKPSRRQKVTAHFPRRMWQPAKDSLQEGPSSHGDGIISSSQNGKRSRQREKEAMLWGIGMGLASGSVARRAVIKL